MLGAACRVLPGQYFDSETGKHYNVLPSLGIVILARQYSMEPLPKHASWALVKTNRGGEEEEIFGDALTAAREQ